MEATFILSFFPDREDADRADGDIRGVLAALPRLLHLLVPLPSCQEVRAHPAHLSGLLLVRHVALLRQPHRLLPHEPYVSRQRIYHSSPHKSAKPGKHLLFFLLINKKRAYRPMQPACTT